MLDILIFLFHILFLALLLLLLLLLLSLHPEPQYPAQPYGYWKLLGLLAILSIKYLLQPSYFAIQWVGLTLLAGLVGWSFGAC